jgi:hypothetical protein
VGGPIVNVQNRQGRDPLAKPALIACPLARLGDSKPVFAQYDRGEGNAIGAGNQFHSGNFTVGNGSESMGIQNQRHVSV